MSKLPESPNIVGAPLEEDVLTQFKRRSERLNQTGVRDKDNILSITNKNCWVKLSSFVSIDQSGIDELRKSIGKEITLENGINLAKEWVLQAEQKNGSELKYGIGGPTKAYGTGGTSELGYRPMPGITSVQIESQPPLGAIRSSVVKFKAWNLAQLSVLDILYFRLGFTMLLEWGHTTYTDNTGTLITQTLPLDIFSNGKENLSKEEILKQLAKKRKDTSFNYDGSLALVTNYSWAQANDGSYDCTLHLVGIGSVIESLKVNTQDAMPDNIVPSTVTSNQVSTPDDSSLLGFLTITENQPQDTLDYTAVFSKGANLLNVPTEAFTYGYNTSYMGLPSGTPVPTTIPKIDIKKLSTRFTTFILDESNKQVTSGKKHTYIKLGMLLAYLNNSCVLYEGNKPFIPIDFNPDTNFCLRIPQQFSVDPLVCLVDIDCSDIDYNELLVVKGKSLKNVGSPTSPSTGTISKNITTGAGGYIDSTAGKTYRGKFMNIFVNTSCIRQALTECTDSNKNVFLKPFLENLMNKIQIALGNINNFKVSIDEIANTAYIYDAQLVDQETLSNAIPTLPVFGLTSIVRDFNLKTEASTRIGNMLAITARAGAVNTGQNQDAAAFTLLNRSLKDRLLPTLSTTSTPIPINSTSVTTQTAVLATSQNLNLGAAAEVPDVDGIASLASNFNTQIAKIYGVNTTSSVIRYNKEGIESIKNYYLDAILRIKGKINSSSSTGDSVTATGILPLALNLTMDGISGIPLYQAFTLPSNRLPAQYLLDGKPRIGFTIAGLNHTIENNQWTTSIRGLMINLPSGSRPYTPNYKAKTNTVSNIPTPATTGGVLSGDYIPYTKLKPTTQQAITQGLVLVREAATVQRTVGTMWYKGNVIGFVVEDPVRGSKSKDTTAIPAGTYTVVLDTTNNPRLKPYYAQFPGEKGKLAFPGVIPRVGDRPTAVNLKGPGNLDFSGIRIHGGVSENNSSGCLIYSSKRNPNGTVVNDIAHNKALTRLIFYDKIKKITIINEFK